MSRPPTRARSRRSRATGTRCTPAPSMPPARPTGVPCFTVRSPPESSRAWRECTCPAPTAHPDMLAAGSLEQLAGLVRTPIAGIVHCAWPAPDNERLTSLANIDSAFEHNLGAPLRQVIALAQLLAARGTDDAILVLVGSSAALPGRHNYKSPLYSLSKALIPELTRILATGLASSNKRCAAVTYDVIDGGMNKRLSPSARVAHTDRMPSGVLPTMSEAAAQIEWVLDNASFLVSGATIALTGAAAP